MPDEAKKDIILKKTPATDFTRSDFSGLGVDIKDLNHHLGSLTKEIAAQRAKIEGIKRRQDNFEKEVEFLKSDEEVGNGETEFDRVDRGFESAKVIDDINMLVEKQVLYHIKALEHQLDEEKRNSAEFKKTIENKLQKFTQIEKNLVLETEHLESEIQEKTMQLLRAEKFSSMGDLTSILVQDLRKSLSVIGGTSQMVKNIDPNITDVSKERLELIERSILKMTHQLDDLIGYTAMDALVKDQASLNEIILAAIHTLTIPTNIAVTIPEEDIVFSCDRQKMETVFYNMILNSIQAIGNRSGAINIKTKQQDDSILITIEDSGSGIPESIAGKIFDPLITSKQDGIGLGLATCKNIISQHNGTITVNTDPTVFSIVLPQN
jgi:signal transduction histidine kinase